MDFKPTTRRHLITSISILITPFLASDPFSPFPLPVSHARGLFQMPPFRLTNRYFLVRAGESEYESLGLINTNPVAKTSVDNGLSEKGKKQTVRAAFDLKEMRASDGNCWIWPSITQRASQAAVNGVNRSHIAFSMLVDWEHMKGKGLDSLSKVYESDSVLMTEHLMRVFQMSLSV